MIMLLILNLVATAKPKDSNGINKKKINPYIIFIMITIALMMKKVIMPFHRYLIRARETKQ